MASGRPFRDSLSVPHPLPMLPTGSKSHPRLEPRPPINNLSQNSRPCRFGYLFILPKTKGHL